MTRKISAIMQSQENPLDKQDKINRYIYIILLLFLVGPLTQYIFYYNNWVNYPYWTISVVINMVIIPFTIVFSAIKIHKYYKDTLDRYFCRDIIFYISILSVIGSGILLMYIYFIWTFEINIIPTGDPTTNRNFTTINSHLLLEAAPLFIVGVFLPLAIIVGLIGIYSRRITHHQRQYITRIEQKQEQLELFQDLLPNSIDNDKEIHCRLCTAMKSLTEATQSVRAGDYVSFLFRFYYVEREHIYFSHIENRHHETKTTPINQEDKDLLGHIVREIRTRATGSLPNDEQKKIDGYLLNETGKPKTAPTVPELKAAMLVIHEWDIKRLNQFMQVERFLQMLILSFVIIFASTLLLETDLEVIRNNSTQFGIGVIGAWFSMILPIGERLREEEIISDESLPSPTLLTEAIVARLLIGGISAIAVVSFLAPDQLFVADVGEFASFPIAFISGFSERFVKGTIKRFEETLSSTTEKSDTLDPD